jgi:hypothetical protein
VFGQQLVSCVQGAPDGTQAVLEPPVPVSTVVEQAALVMTAVTRRRPMVA